MGQNRFKKLSKFQKFQLSNFTLTWSNEGKINRLDMTYSKTYLQKYLNYTILVKYCVMAITSNNIRFLMGIERSLSQKGIMKVYENILIQPLEVHKVLSL